LVEQNAKAPHVDFWADQRVVLLDLGSNVLRRAAPLLHQSLPVFSAIALGHDLGNSEVAQFELGSLIGIVI